MNETPEEFRQRVERVDSHFFEEYEKRSAPIRDLGFEYEKLAIGYSEKGFQTLTYLNGGALVAIPTAMAFFKAEVARGAVMWTAGAFIAGLLCVLVAQMAAFFTMSRRSEAQGFFARGQFNRVAALQYPLGTSVNTERFANSQADEAAGKKKMRRSDYWSWAGLFFFFMSMVAFIVGCVLGGAAVISAKEKAASIIVQIKPV